MNMKMKNMKRMMKNMEMIIEIKINWIIKQKNLSSEKAIITKKKIDKKIKRKKSPKKMLVY